ncbi:MAG: WbqC family protein [Bacteroidetes bacterium]|nr:WbqC family protein [Bacteroidota bacterium]
MNCILTDIQYFGTVNWYKMLFRFSNIQFEQYETYQKMSFRNRCMIVGSNGLINLSVPLEKGRSQKLLMKDVRISYSENWQEQHWRSITSCYGNSPFFEFYEESLRILFETRHTYLIDLNWQTFEWVTKRLKFEAPLERTDQYLEEVADNCFDARNLVKPKAYDQVKEIVNYQQVFEDRIGFKPNLCILDLMFCNGPSSKSLITSN